jgi:hypothetical protein
MKTSVDFAARNGNASSVQAMNGTPPGYRLRLFLAAALLLVPWMSACSTVTSDTATAGAQGAAGVPVRPPTRISLDEVVTLSRQGVGADALIARIQASRSYYRLSAGEIISLRERGVPMAVIDYMLTAERQYAQAGSAQPAEKVKARPAVKDRKDFVAALYHGF